MVISEAFIVRCNDVWNKICWISCLHYISLSHVFDNYIQNIICRISADISDIGIFLLPDIVIGIGPKNPISDRPYLSYLYYCSNRDLKISWHLVLSLSPIPTWNYLFQLTWTCAGWHATVMTHSMWSAAGECLEWYAAELLAAKKVKLRKKICCNATRFL